LRIENDEEDDEEREDSDDAEEAVKHALEACARVHII